MGFFSFDESKAGSTIPVGFYETYITEVKPKTFGTGSTGYALTLVVRTDVDQVGGKTKLTENLVMSEAAAFKIHSLLKALGVPDGTNFETEQDFVRTIINQPLRVKVVHETYEGEQRARVKSYFMTEVGGEYEDDFEQPGLGGRPIDISEEDLPF